MKTWLTLINYDRHTCLQHSIPRKHTLNRNVTNMMMYLSLKSETNHDLKFWKKSNWDAKYVSNFRVIKLIVARQLEVSDPTGRLWKVNISNIHKILSADFIVCWLLDEQIFARKGKYINGPCILKVVSAIDSFLHDYFPNIRVRHQ